MASADASNPWTTEPQSDLSGADSHAFSEDDAIRCDEEDNDDAEFTYPGDYSSHMEELFDGEEPADEERSELHDDEEEEDGGFIYDGVDADTSIGYKAQLREVLGQDHDEEESEADVLDVERSLAHDTQDEYQADTSVCVGPVIVYVVMSTYAIWLYFRTANL